ncbi:MAG: sortase [Chloroflexi bacterium]|jgi:LPXTG-site transpeptidase (sortase) family protein|nr:sortase [Chloroflexota bacterium]MBT5627097.1 sortase [Chloroflexota bacterium]
MANQSQTPDSAQQGSKPTGKKYSATTIAAYSVAIVGVVLIIASGVYFYSRSQSGSDSAEYAYSIPPETLDSHLGKSIVPAPDAPATGENPIPLELKAPDVAQFASLYPGDQLNPKYWSEPEWAGSDPFGGPTIPDDFVPILSTDLFRDIDPTTDATRIRIPAINVDSTVAELEIVDLGSQQSYQTPNNTVGHIPETSSPGAQGSGWFFAHLESFVAREGNIFRHLPEITELIKEDPVDVYLETPDAEYIYRVTGTSQVHENDLQLSSSDDAQITLVTCWPPRVYDQRVLVDATLIAYRPL